MFDCQIETLKQELNKKESEMQALHTKLETLTNQNSDCKQHIDVLKESLAAKEQRANTLQTEVSGSMFINTYTYFSDSNTIPTIFYFLFLNSKYDISDFLN